MRSVVAALALALALSVGAGCATVESAERGAAEALISTDQEKQLGDEIHKQLEAEGIRYVEDPVVTQEINKVAAPILQQAKQKRPDINFHIHVVDAPDSVNAFATPGGHIYVESGLLGAVSNEAELAGVLAHEAAHITERHAARNMVRTYGLQTVAGLALGQNPSQLQQIAASIVANGTLLAYSRAQETEADEIGAVFASKTQYTPMGLVGFLSYLLKQTGETPRALTWLQTHPASEDRIAHLRDFIQKNHLGGGSNGGNLAAIKSRLPAVGGAGNESHGR